ncbi:MAG TPA: DUF6569 family protein [Armatimonadota bacterium]|nr:DUF6569 family protein [Armatimonadota bacterium]
MKAIEEYISHIELADPVVYQNLAMFPLVSGENRQPDYLTLDEALAQRSVSVTEVSAGGSVPELKFVNRGAMPVLLLDGEELIGAKQNRILNLTILAPAAKTIVIPVSCVEAGRWSQQTMEFAAAPRAHFAEGRRNKMMRVTESLIGSGTRGSDQGEVWEDVAAKARRMETRSPTGAMSEIFEKHTGTLEGYAAALQPVDRQVGALFAINGVANGFDLFDCQPTLAKLLPKIVLSYALDALDAHQETTGAERADAEALLKAAAAAETSTFPAVGLGEDVRLTGGGFAGGGLIWSGRVTHLGGFKLTGSAQNPLSQAGMTRASSRRQRRFERVGG